MKSTPIRRALLLLVLIFSCVLQSLAGTDFTYKGITYTVLTDNTCETKQGRYGIGTWLAGNKFSGDLVIPKTVRDEFGYDYTVTKIGDYAFYNCPDLTSVTIPNSVTSIGKYAFSDCYDLASVTIPNSVASIGDGAFSGCSDLTSVTIPNSVTSIGDGAFSGCSDLTSVTIPNSVTSIGDSAFQGCNGLAKVCITDLASWCGISFSDEYSNPLYYAHHLYLNDIEVKNLVIPKTVASIGVRAFANCSALTSATISSSVSDYAFYGCTGLTSVTIGSSVTSIGSNAFENCSGLTKVCITDLAAWCGINYSADEYANPLYYAHHLYLNDIEVTNLVIPGTVTSIGDLAFADCYGLTSVTIPNSVTSIGDLAFADCHGLTSVAIPNSVTSIGGEAFINCSGLTSVSISNSVTEISDGAFYGCDGLTSVIIPNSVTSIGYYAFEYCSGLTSVAISNSVTSIGGEAFAGCYGLTSVTIPNSVSSIGDSAFASCYGLTSVSIASSVKRIGSGTFQGCDGLTSVIIPNSVTSIGYYAFEYCSGITNLTFMDGADALTINTRAFNLVTPTKVYFGRQMNFTLVPCTALETVEFGENVASIKVSAFKDGSAIRTVISHNPVPPTTGGDPFDDTTYLKGELYVPKASIEAYQIAAGWKKFSGIKPLSEHNGVDEIVVDNGNDAISVENGTICVNGDTDVRIVTMNGTTVYSGRGEARVNVAPGIYVVIIGNTAHKVAVG
jgi:hypothetical protein